MEKLIELGYDSNKFNGVINKETINIHHTKHLAAYVSKYNAAIKDTSLDMQDLEEVIINLNTLNVDNIAAIRNNGGGVINHNLYFSQFGNNPISEVFNKIIIDAFGSVEKMIKEINDNAMAQFGSGWAWLVADSEQNLSIIKTANQDCPLTEGLIPLIAIDVWEHAYYLDYQNRRAEYLENIWKIIDWKVVEERYKKINKII